MISDSITSGVRFVLAAGSGDAAHGRSKAAGPECVKAKFGDREVEELHFCPAKD
jgi:hypothetical protein